MYFLRYWCLFPLWCCHWGCVVMALFFYFRESNSAKCWWVLSSVVITVLLTFFLPTSSRFTFIFLLNISGFCFIMLLNLVQYGTEEPEKEKSKLVIWSEDILQSGKFQFLILLCLSLFSEVFFYLCYMSLRPTTVWSYIRDHTNPKNSMSDLPNWSLL